MPVKPIKPNEVPARKIEAFPDAVLESFNELIIKNYSHGSSKFKLEEVVKLMVSKGLNSKEIFDNHYLDVEPLYRKQGWEVEYDQPGYNESGPSTYTFTGKI